MNNTNMSIDKNNVLLKILFKGFFGPLLKVTK